MISRIALDTVFEAFKSEQIFARGAFEGWLSGHHKVGCGQEFILNSVKPCGSLADTFIS